MPLEIGWAATVEWKAGDSMCRIMAFFRTFGLYLSSFVLVCISLDRYLHNNLPSQILIFLYNNSYIPFVENCGKFSRIINEKYAKTHTHKNHGSLTTSTGHMEIIFTNFPSWTFVRFCMFFFIFTFLTFS